MAKKKIKKEQENEDLCLTEAEIAKMENFSISEKLDAAELKNADLLLKCKRLEIEKAELQCTQLSSDYRKRKEAVLINKASKTNFINLIKEKYKIEQNNFGYNPDTGQLILEEQ